MKPRMSEASLMSPTTDILTTPKQESIKTPKFREFSSELAALRSPRTEAVDSLHTPLALTTPLLGHLAGAGAGLDTPTLTTPRTADWGLFSPIALGSNCSSPSARDTPRDTRPADLPLDSSIGLSSPHDGILAKRRKLKNLSSSHSRSVESDSNSCDTPGSAAEAGSCAAADLTVPRDLSKKCSEREARVSPHSTTDLDTVRGPERGGEVKISSPKWFKHPKHLESLKLSNKELLADLPSSYHPSPLAVPSPNWTAIKELLCSNTQTPKVLDNFVFDVLPPHTPTAKSCRAVSPEPSQQQEARHKPEPAEARPRPRPEGGQRVTFAELPRPGSLTPPPPCPQDLSIRRDSCEAGHRLPKTEPAPAPVYRPSPPSPPPYPDPAQVKEEPREVAAPAPGPPALPPGFPPYYLPNYSLYNRHEPRLPQHPTVSPPASPPRSGGPQQPSSSGLPAHYAPQHRPPQFYGTAASKPGLSLSSLYEQHGPHAHAQYNMWNGSHHVPGELGHVSGHVTMPTPPQNLWSRVSAPHQDPAATNGQLAYGGSLKAGLDKIHIKAEQRLSTDSQESAKKKSRKLKPGDSDLSELDSSLDGQPPKKKGKAKAQKTNKDPAAPKRVFVCPHCNVSISQVLIEWHKDGKGNLSRMSIIQSNDK